MPSRRLLTIFANMERRIYAATGIKTTAVFVGAGTALSSGIAVTFLAVLVLMLLSRGGSIDAEELPQYPGALLLGITVYVLLLLCSAYGGFVAAKKAGEQELLHSLLAALVATLLGQLLVAWTDGSSSSMDIPTVSLVHVVAAGVGGFVALRRHKNAERAREVQS